MFGDLSKLQGPNNIDLDGYDERLYNELKEASPKLRQLEDAKGGTWPALMKDVWGTFYKAVPELTPDALVDPPHTANRPFVERLLEDPQTEQTRITTMLDELTAGMAAIAAGTQLKQEFANRPELDKAMEKAQEAMEAMESESKQKSPEEIEQMMQEALDQLGQEARQVRRAIRKAVKAGEEEANELTNSLAGWGLEPGDLKSVPIGERMQLAERLVRNPRMKHIADLIGRFRNLARAKQKDKMEKRRDEIHSITVGDDLAHMLPTELAALRHPTRKLDFYRKFTEKQLLQYELNNNEPKGRGPMVCAIDISGSMEGAPLDWAICTALALVDTAARQKRRAHVMFFNSSIAKELKFEPGERDIQKYIDVATTGTSGGTLYEPPMRRAMELITTSEYQKADFVFVTDGLCGIDDNFMQEYLEVKERMQFRGWAILLGSDYEGALKRWNDKIWTVSRFTEETAGEIFVEVA